VVAGRSLAVPIINGKSQIPSGPVTLLSFTLLKCRPISIFPFGFWSGANRVQTTQKTDKNLNSKWIDIVIILRSEQADRHLTGQEKQVVTRLHLMFRRPFCFAVPVPPRRFFLLSRNRIRARHKKKNKL